MLAYVLAIVVAIESFSFYMAAFFVPEIHRRQDFLWSGLGMFYAVVLWFCAGRITGAVLLGQMASVALLGWLGWQTLALRRDLTPETVQTPVTWADLQRWWNSIQKQLGQYIKVGSLFASVQAVWADVSRAIADLRNRTAGPRGVDAASEVPPLRRSPAYEFETAQGEGQAVPSEFATVATAPREQTIEPPPSETAQAAQSAQTPDDLPASEEQPESESALDTSVAVTDTASDAATVPPAKSISRRPQSADAKSIDKAKGDTEKSTAPAAKPAPKSDRQPAQVSAKSAKSTVRNNPKTKKGASKTANPVTGAATWLGDVAKSFRKPKPQRGVIEIPPRPPSIPRSSEEAPKTQKASQQRAVPPAPTQREANWVDVGNADELDNLDATTFTQPPSRSAETRVLRDSPLDNQNINDSQEMLEDTNWPDEDVADEFPSATQSSSFDEEETNWPD